MARQQMFAVGLGVVMSLSLFTFLLEDCVSVVPVPAKIILGLSVAVLLQLCVLAKHDIFLKFKSRWSNWAGHARPCDCRHERSHLQEDFCHADFSCSTSSMASLVSIDGFVFVSACHVCDCSVVKAKFQQVMTCSRNTRMGFVFYVSVWILS